jgi:hypothetical protein
MAVPRSFVAALALVLTAVPAAAQSQRPAVVMKAGVNIERAEDQVEGESPAFGADVLLPLGGRWTFDAEFWLPAYFTTPGGYKHRDILWSIGILREFGNGRARPFLSFGLGGLTTQEQRASFGDTSSTAGVYYIGAGATLPVGQRFAVVPELRASLAAGSALLRPSVGVAYRF